MEPLSAHSEREWALVGMAECCATRGFEATTVADVCAAAGVPQESFERLFDDREDCLAAAVEAVVAEAEHRIAARCSPAKAWTANVRTATRTLLGLLAERPTFAYTALIEAPAVGGRAAAVYAAGKAALLRHLERGSEQAGAEEGIPASAGRAALAGAEALVVGHLRAGAPGEQLATLAPSVIYMLTVPYFGRTAAARAAAEDHSRGSHLRAVA